MGSGCGITQLVQMLLALSQALGITLKTEISKFHFTYVNKEEYSAGPSYPNLPAWGCPIAPTRRIGLLEGAGSVRESTSPLRSPSSGYAVEVISRRQVQNFVMGAPRYQHTGLVAMFRQNAGAWENNAYIKGSQVSAEHMEHECTTRGTWGPRDSRMSITRCHAQQGFVKEPSEGFEMERRRISFASESIVSSLF